MSDAWIGMTLNTRIADQSSYTRPLFMAWLPHGMAGAGLLDYLYDGLGLQTRVFLVTSKQGRDALLL